MYANVCRGCLTNEFEMKYIFQINVCEQPAIKIFENVTSLQVKEDDQMPKFICIQCLLELENAHNFQKKCLLSFETVKNYLIDNANSIEKDTFEIKFNIEEGVVENKIKGTEWNSYPNSNNCQNTAILKKYSSSKNHETKNDIILNGLEKIKDECENNYANEYENESDLKIDNALINDDFFNESSTDANHHKETSNSFTCDVCNKSFRYEKSKNKHISLHKHVCNYLACSKHFTKLKQLQIHKRSHNLTVKKSKNKIRVKKLKCDICYSEFTRPFHLTQHILNSQHGKLLECTLCKYSCSTERSLQRHLLTHGSKDISSVRIHKCDICDKVFEYPSSLAEHMKSHTGDKPYLCSVCGKSFRQKGGLKYHIRYHTGQKPYSCKFCTESFGTQSVLKAHERRHTDERPYVCDICGKAFRQSTDMRSHQLVHTGAKPVECTICGKRMTRTGALTVHMRIHTGEKPHVCITCGKGFVTRTLLLRHVRVHSGEKPYVCSVCNRAFSQSSSLNAHKKVHDKKVDKVKKKSYRHENDENDSL